MFMVYYTNTELTITAIAAKQTTRMIINTVIYFENILLNIPKPRIEVEENKNEGE